MNPTDRPWLTNELVERFAAYHRDNSTWGSLHIVLEDYNLTNNNVKFCIDWAEQRGDQEGFELAHILLTLTKTQRLHLAKRADTYGNPDTSGGNGPTSSA